MVKCQKIVMPLLRHSGFGIRSSLVIRPSSFLLEHHDRAERYRKQQICGTRPRILFRKRVAIQG